MASRTVVFALLAALAMPVVAYVPGVQMGAVQSRRMAGERGLTRSTATLGDEPVAEPSAAQGPEPFSLAALACSAGAAVGWVHARRRKAAASAAVAAAGLSPLAAGAADGSSLSLAMDPLSNPDLGFVFLTSLASMSIALVVWGRNGL
mmetsp:Transcript_48480/g.97872  ORF Transcript_48480/g.97872 Transcript_48480/m.97872 type:complete len:148 (+) Transcript_48480:98-541(+)